VNELDKFLGELCEKGSMWDGIIDNIIGTHDKNLKRALISEIALSYLERREKIEEILKDEKYFKYYFIQTIMNQVKSNTSPLYKNHKKMIGNGIEEFDFSFLEIVDTSRDDINEKVDKELKLKDIDEKLLMIKINWFEGQMFDLYYKKGLTYRQIEKEWGVNFLTVFSAVKRVKEKILSEIK
jgi:hypothetical protein